MCFSVLAHSNINITSWENTEGWVFNYSFNGRGISSVFLSVTAQLFMPWWYRNEILKLYMSLTVYMHTQYVLVYRLISQVMRIYVHNLNMCVGSFASIGWIISEERAADIHPLVDRRGNPSAARLIPEYVFQPCFEIKWMNETNEGL